jgi:hypothetical protein
MTMHYPGASKFTVTYVARRGEHKGWTITYTYWKSRIMVNGKPKFLGHYQTAQEASLVYLAARERLRKGQPI